MVMITKAKLTAVSGGLGLAYVIYKRHLAHPLPYTPRPNSMLATHRHAFIHYGPLTINAPRRRRPLRTQPTTELTRQIVANGQQIASMLPVKVICLAVSPRPSQDPAKDVRLRRSFCPQFFSSSQQGQDSGLPAKCTIACFPCQAARQPVSSNTQRRPLEKTAVPSSYEATSQTQEQGKIGGGQWCPFHALVAHGMQRKGRGACNSNPSLLPSWCLSSRRRVWTRPFD